MEAALQLGDPVVCKECAELLEHAGQLQVKLRAALKLRRACGRSATAGGVLSPLARRAQSVGHQADACLLAQAAAQLYEAAGDHSAATALYIRGQSFDEASRLIGDSGSRKQLLGLAQAREGAPPFDLAD